MAGKRTGSAVSRMSSDTHSGSINHLFWSKLSLDCHQTLTLAPYHLFWSEGSLPDYVMRSRAQKTNEDSHSGNERNARDRHHFIVHHTMAALHWRHRRPTVSRQPIILFLCLQFITRSAESFLILYKRDVPIAYRYAAATKDDDSSYSSHIIPPLFIHHAALKTRNITTAIQFYSLLDYQVTCRFRAGPARAAWLELATTASSSSSSSPKTNGLAAARLEIIEVPSYMLNETEGSRRRAMDLMQRQDLLGYNHVALDVTAQIQLDSNMNSLQDWLEHLNKKSFNMFGKTLRVALKPRQQIIGRGVYELAFLYDADGCLVELLHKQSELSQDLESGWQPWDGKGFVGENDGESKLSSDE